MEWFSEIESRKLFKSNKYRVIRQPWGFELKNESYIRQIVSVFLWAFGVLLLFISLTTGSWKLTLFSVILLGLPFTLHNWKMPMSVRFNEQQNHIKIGSKRVVTRSDSPELVVNYESRTSFVSPFEEGYLDHYYIFLLRIKNKSEIPLLKLKSRKQIDEQIQGLVTEFSKLGIWKN